MGALLMDNRSVTSVSEPRRFSAQEYPRLAEVGILRRDERVELIDGT